MSSEVAVSLRGLGKHYRRASSGARPTTLAEAAVTAIRRRRAAAEEFWALKDVTFDVERGTLLGIVGRNGAGKSTLLKILSRITEPTEGEATLHGSVGSLLEVGTGFHPELTGRENIFLNGALLGMRRAVIRAQFEEIVEFSGIEPFLETPVKRYSSGMYVRLAFAVAAHLSPSILIIDEVLAVGDTEFQRKCLGKMESVAHTEGRTVLFVSHNFAAVSALCDRCVLLDGGRVQTIGGTNEVLREYMSGLASDAYRRFPDGAYDVSDHVQVVHAGPRVLQSVALVDAEERAVETVAVGGSLNVDVRLRGLEGVDDPAVAIAIESDFDQRVILLTTRMHARSLQCRPGQETIVRFALPSLPLPPGRYYAQAALQESERWIEDARRVAPFTVVDEGFYGDDWKIQAAPGTIVADFSWRQMEEDSRVIP
jgi:lipopolysaccharide transport system ATP-binding protein